MGYEPLVPAVQDGEASGRVEAVGGEERDARVAREERVAAGAALRPRPLSLRERVNGEAAGPLEPELVAGADRTPSGARSRCRPSRGRGLRPSRLRARRPARSARRPRPAAPRRGTAPRSRRSRARRGTTGRGSRRACPRAPRRSCAGQFASPSSRTASAARIAAVSRSSSGVRVTLQQRMDVPDETVRRAEAAPRLHAVEPLRPDPIRVAPREQSIGALAPGFGPALLPGPAVHRVGGEHRPGRAPHQLLGLVGDVLAYARDERVGQIVGSARAARRRRGSRSRRGTARTRPATGAACRRRRAAPRARARAPASRRRSGREPSRRDRGGASASSAQTTPAAPP